MIVFTATNLKTQDVYVGTARESVEEEWADLLSQADSGTSGQFFQQLRDHGSVAFEVDTWAYGENAAEARESMREARDELGAQSIKSNRGLSAGRSTQAVQSASMKALMAVFEEALTSETPLDEDDMLEGLVPDSSRGKKAPVTDALDDDEDDEVDEAPVQKAVTPKAATPKAATRKSAPRTAPPPSASDDEKMSSRLEAMKAAQEKLLRERDARGDDAPGAGNFGVIGANSTGRSAPVKAPKIASGRTGSADKERRIREALEVERDRRDALRHTGSREEQTEMNVVMARIELRRLATKKANAEKAKVQAAERRAKAKAEATNIALALARETAANAAQNEPGATTAPVSEGLQAEGLKAVKVAPPKAAVAKPATAKGAASQVPAGQSAQAKTTLKLAAGRTGSGQKEKRIREAIEQEKVQRQTEQQARRAAEAKEMAEILAKLEERTKEAEKLKRRR